MKSVFVTGTSSGIGRAIALRLDAYGWRVLAGVRTAEDAARIEHDGSTNLNAVIIDITDDDSIEAAIQAISHELSSGLDALINNAGIAVEGPLEYLSQHALRRQFDVNVNGQVACTQAFLPALRAVKGRIVFVTSVQGDLPPVPLFGAYSASKHALETIAESFRIEVRSDDISVSVVAPGTVRTTIWAKAREAIEKDLAELRDEGSERYRRMLERGIDISEIAQKIGVSPERVARVVHRALEARRPKRRYRVGDSRPRALLEKPLPAAIRDRVLDKGWAASRESLSR